MRRKLNDLGCQGAALARRSRLKAYICLITVRAGQVPHLRHIECADDDAIPKSLTPLLTEWPQVHRIEVFDDDRLAFAADAPNLTPA